MEKLIEAYKAVNPNASIDLQTSDSTSGMTGTMDGTFAIGMASRELKDDEACLLYTSHKEAIQSVSNILLDPEKGVISSMSEIDAVGHRVVHGGEFFSDSVIITEKVLKAIEDCVPPVSYTHLDPPSHFHRGCPYGVPY